MEVPLGVRRRGGGRAPTPNPLHPFYSWDVNEIQYISTVAFQNNAWEYGKPRILTFLVGALRGWGAWFTPLSYIGIIHARTEPAFKVANPRLRKAPISVTVVIFSVGFSASFQVYLISDECSLRGYNSSLLSPSQYP